MTPSQTVLIAFDGSADAARAIHVAGDLLPGRPAVVLTVWEPLLVALAHHPLTALAPVPFSAEEEDERSADSARLVAARGADLARSAGFDAQALSRADSHEIAETIRETADSLDAALIVTGSRGLRGRSARHGSVSEHVLEHAGRPVLIVPSSAT
ncbi:universal stress protein [Paraconexibacter antarcticus]|uniref:Universal stress protein n=1 Tax=Paraconexibacter antarcticus TaxID=2949664 RepID=A0ABY5DW91_9ACTN|nr:universal stress protein [Paraconexibacter antarcticus]UTI66288.1 universal stress protein [Paraconexibacter antarcticus]